MHCFRSQFSVAFFKIDRPDQYSSSFCKAAFYRQANSVGTVVTRLVKRPKQKQNTRYPKVTFTSNRCFFLIPVKLLTVIYLGAIFLLRRTAATRCCRLRIVLETSPRETRCARQHHSGHETLDRRKSKASIEDVQSLKSFLHFAVKPSASYQSFQAVSETESR